MDRMGNSNPTFTSKSTRMEYNSWSWLKFRSFPSLNGVINDHAYEENRALLTGESQSYGN